jgi:hypothetical protein
MAPALLELEEILGRPAVDSDTAANNKAEARRAEAETGRRLTAPRRPRAAIPPLIPMSKSAWWKGIREGRIPAPVKIGRRSFWRADDVRRLIEEGAAP